MHPVRRSVPAMPVLSGVAIILPSFSSSSLMIIGLSIASYLNGKPELNVYVKILALLWT